MTNVNQIHHIAIVVDRIEDSLDFWKLLGLEVETIKEVEEEEARVAFLPAGNTKIELVEPTTDSSGIARYLAKRGPGLHHLCIQVDGIDDLLAQLDEKGFKLINPVSQEDPDGRKYAFIHPKSTQGVLVELYEAPA
jgi:methylmalonyl-CoA/ethylmalonyl-CoA epimerase